MSVDAGELDAALLRLGVKYGFDEAHARQVARLADELAEHLAPLHRLDAEFRGALRAAALAHDVGQAVAERGHHRHSAYLIRFDETLAAFPASLRRLVALLARSHRKRLPELPAAWNRPRRQRFLQAAALLRLADGLDGAHDGSAGVHACHIRSATVLVEVDGLDPPALQRVLKRKASIFAPAFGRRVALAPAAVAARGAGA